MKRVNVERRGGVEEDEGGGKMLTLVFCINCRLVSSAEEISFAREIRLSVSAATVESNFVILHQK